MGLVAVRDNTGHVLAPLTAVPREILAPLASLRGQAPGASVAPSVSALTGSDSVLKGTLSL